MIMNIGFCVTDVLLWWSTGLLYWCYRMTIRDVALGEGRNLCLSSPRYWWHILVIKLIDACWPVDFKFRELVNNKVVNGSPFFSASMLQVRDPSRAPGLTVRRNLPARMSSPATPAPTQGRNASCAHCVISASCAATTWSSTPAVTPNSSLPCWDAARAPPPVPAQPCTIRMVWVSWQEHRRSRWFQVSQLQSDPLIRI